MSQNILGWVTFQMLFLLFIGSESLGEGGGGIVNVCTPRQAWCFSEEVRRLARCGAMDSQPTQTCADNQNKHVAKQFWA